MSPQLVSLLAAIFAANARILGMQAANNARPEYDPPAYTEDDFAREAGYLDMLASDARSAS